MKSALDLLMGGGMQELTDLREWGGFTHAGTVPLREVLGGLDGIVGGVLVWGVAHPDPVLWIFAPRLVIGGYEVPDEGVEPSRLCVPCSARMWLQLTHMSPPWPWAEGGDVLDFEHDHRGRRV